MVREALAVLCANVKGVGDARIDFRGVWTLPQSSAYWAVHLAIAVAVLFGKPRVRFVPLSHIYIYINKDLAVGR